MRSSSRVRACDEVRFCPHSTRALVQPACRSRQPTVRLRRKRSSAMPKRQRDAASTDREQATADGAGDVCSDEEEEHAASAGVAPPHRPSPAEGSRRCSWCSRRRRCLTF